MGARIWNGDDAERNPRFCHPERAQRVEGSAPLHPQWISRGARGGTARGPSKSLARGRLDADPQGHLFGGCGWRGALRRREPLDPESSSPRSRSALRALRVNLLPFPFAVLGVSAPPREIAAIAPVRGPGSSYRVSRSRAISKSRLSPSRKIVASASGLPAPSNRTATSCFAGSPSMTAVFHASAWPT